MWSSLKCYLNSILHPWLRGLGYFYNPFLLQSQMNFPGIKLSRVFYMIRWNSATEMTQTFIHLLESDHLKKYIVLKVPSCSSAVWLPETVMASTTLHLRSLTLFLCVLCYWQWGPVSLIYLHLQNRYQEGIGRKFLGNNIFCFSMWQLLLEVNKVFEDICFDRYSGISKKKGRESRRSSVSQLHPLNFMTENSDFN